MTPDCSTGRSTERASEIVIVGGSAAGLFAGYLLARAGRQVRLYDANDVLHASARTLITTSELENVLGFFPDEAVVNTIDRFDLFSPERSATVRVRQPDLVVERAAIVRVLAGRALRAGVEIHSGCKVLDVQPAHTGLALTIRDRRRGRVEAVQATTLIGADGAFSRVAGLANQSSHETTPILQAVVELPDPSQVNTTQVWFAPQDTPYFYWLIPQSTRHAAVGLIGAEGNSTRSKLERFLSQRRLKPLDIQAARVPVYAHASRTWRKICGCDVYLVGDAAAQVKVTTVGGLVTGLRGAKAVAGAILKNPNYSGELKSLRRELSLHLLIRTVLNRFRSRDYDRLLELLSARTIDLLGLHSRDRAATMLFKIILAQPRLLSFATLVCRAMYEDPILAKSFGGLHTRHLSLPKNETLL